MGKRINDDQGFRTLWDFGASVERIAEFYNMQPESISSSAKAFGYPPRGNIMKGQKKGKGETSRRMEDRLRVDAESIAHEIMGRKRCSVFTVNEIIEKLEKVVVRERRLGEI